MYHERTMTTGNYEALLCFSHLRWNFVWQRPQHIMTRFAAILPVYYIEEPVFSEIILPVLDISEPVDNVFVVVPVLPANTNADDIVSLQSQLLKTLIAKKKISTYISWYYTPMALPFTGFLKPQYTVYDCMDELSAFKFAPPRLRALENNLINIADAVFTGGHSIYNAKKHLHTNIHAFPSSIDKAHFEQARHTIEIPNEQAAIPNPCFGFAGVIDERFDVELLSTIARLKPEWHFAIIGPVVKIDAAVLPVLPNIHYLGPKKYNDLPSYIAGWDVALILFALNESTKYISPTKTPEYLAAGKPVISTAIADVVSSYGEAGLVKIINNAREFITAAQDILQAEARAEWLAAVDEYLKDISWDTTWQGMVQIISSTGNSNNKAAAKQTSKVYV